MLTWSRRRTFCSQSMRGTSSVTCARTEVVRVRAFGSSAETIAEGISVSVSSARCFVEVSSAMLRSYQCIGARLR
eukprot:4997478-Prymnesium_polylepis.2